MKQGAARAGATVLELSSRGHESGQGRRDKSNDAEPDAQATENPAAEPGDSRKGQTIQDVDGAPSREGDTGNVSEKPRGGNNQGGGEMFSLARAPEKQAILDRIVPSNEKAERRETFNSLYTKIKDDLNPIRCCAIFCPTTQCCRHTMMRTDCGATQISATSSMSSASRPSHPLALPGDFVFARQLSIRQS
jgi:hypothetical protein